MHQDIVQEIAKHLPPDPNLYFRLAMVSRSFYAVFMSDWAWKYLDVNGVGTDIVSDFKRSSTNDLRRMRTFWNNRSLKRRRVPKYDSTTNRYLRLGALLNFERHPEIFIIKDKRLNWCAINLRGETIKKATSKDRRRKRFAIAAVSGCGGSLEFLPYFQDDEEVVLAAVSGDHVDWYPYPSISRSLLRHKNPLLLASNRLRQNRNIVMRAVQVNGCSLKYASMELQKDREIIEAAVAADGMALQFTAFRNDLDIVLIAVKNNSGAFQFASEELRADRQLALRAVSACGTLFEHLPHFHDDEEMVLAAVEADNLPTSYGDYLNVPENVRPLYTFHPMQFASLRLRSKRDVVMRAVRSQGSAIRFASTELRQDREVAMVAVSSDGCALEFCHEFIDDPRIVTAAVLQDPCALQYASIFQRANPEIVRKAVESNGFVLRYASENLRNDRGIVEAAVKQNGNSVYEAPKYYGDKEIMLTAIEKSSRCIDLAHDALLKDTDFMIKAAILDPFIILRDRVRKRALRNKEVVLAAVKVNGSLFRNLPRYLKANNDILQAAVVSYPQAQEWT